MAKREVAGRQWIWVSIGLKLLAFWMLAFACVAILFGDEKEVWDMSIRTKVYPDEWPSVPELSGQFVVVAVAGVAALFSLLTAFLLMCKCMMRPRLWEIIVLLLFLGLLLVSVAVESWYATCYDDDLAKDAGGQGMVCVVGDYAGGVVGLAFGACMFALDAFVFQFLRKYNWGDHAKNRFRKKYWKETKGGPKK